MFTFIENGNAITTTNREPFPLVDHPFLSFARWIQMTEAFNKIELLHIAKTRLINLNFLRMTANACCVTTCTALVNIMNDSI